MISYAPPATVYPHIEQVQMPEADLFSFILEQDGHSRAVFSVLYTLEYLFLTVDPNFAPRPVTAFLFWDISTSMPPRSTFLPPSLFLRRSRLPPSPGRA